MKNTNRIMACVCAWLLWLVLITNASAFYDPGLQRWINRDPIEEDGDKNLFRFVQANPITRNDAFGLTSLPPGWHCPGCPYDPSSNPFNSPRPDMGRLLACLGDVLANQMPSALVPVAGGFVPDLNPFQTVFYGNEEHDLDGVQAGLDVAKESSAHKVNSKGEIVKAPKNQMEASRFLGLLGKVWGIAGIAEDIVDCFLSTAARK